MATRLYIDGFSFYYAIMDKKYGFHDYLAWCDFRKLGEHFINADEILGEIKYFTAAVQGYGRKDGEKDRQAQWLIAIRSVSDLEIIYGLYTSGKNPQRPDEAPKWRNEKQTDVNIGFHMMKDAILDTECERIILITKDIDFAGLVKEIAFSIPTPKFVDVWFPPGNVHKGWSELSKKFDNIQCHSITKDMLEESRLPEELVRLGITVKADKKWRK
jgi:uncharacterized LabA/DUF88 family protein